MFTISSNHLLLRKFPRSQVKTTRRRTLERRERLGERREALRALLISFRSIDRSRSHRRQAKTMLWCRCQSQRTKTMKSRAAREGKRLHEIWEENWSRSRKKISKTIKGCQMGSRRVTKGRLRATEAHIPKQCHLCQWIRSNSCSNKSKHLLTTSRQHICSSHIPQSIPHPWWWRAILTCL